MIKNWFDLPQENLIQYLSFVFKDSNKTSENLSMQALNKDDSINSLCIFHNLRGEIKRCDKKFTTPYGYCATHKNTVQGKNACQKFQELSESLNNVPKVETKNIFKTEEPKKEENIKEHKKSDLKEKVKEPKEKVKEKIEEVPKKVEKIKLSLNKWGNYEHKESGIVFDLKSKCAFGHQKSNGEVYSLKPEHVKLCIQNDWPYILPKAKYEKDESSSSSEEENKSEEEQSEEEESNEQSDEEEQSEEVSDNSNSDSD